jgi:hypothetical protein
MPASELLYRHDDGRWHRERLIQQIRGMPDPPLVDARSGFSRRRPTISAPEWAHSGCLRSLDDNGDLATRTSDQPGDPEVCMTSFTEQPNAESASDMRLVVWRYKTGDRRRTSPARNVAVRRPASVRGVQPQ